MERTEIKSDLSLAWFQRLMSTERLTSKSRGRTRSDETWREMGRDGESKGDTIRGDKGDEMRREIPSWHGINSYFLLK